MDCDSPVNSSVELTLEGLDPPQIAPLFELSPLPNPPGPCLAVARLGKFVQLDQL